MGKCLDETSFDLKVFAENIKRFRLKRALTAVQLAKCINTSVVEIYRWENADFQPSLFNLIKLMTVLQIDFYEFFTDTGTTFANNSEDTNISHICNGRIKIERQTRYKISKIDTDEIPES